MTDDSTGKAEPVTPADDQQVAKPAVRRRLGLLLSVAAVVLALDVVTFRRRLLSVTDWICPPLAHVN